MQTNFHNTKDNSKTCNKVDCIIDFYLSSIEQNIWSSFCLFNIIFFRANELITIFRLKVEKVFVSTEELLPRGRLSVKGIEFSSNKDPLLSRSGDKGYIPTAKTRWSILEIMFSWKSEDQQSQNLLLSFHLLQSLIPFTVPMTQPLFSTIPDPFRRTWIPNVIFSKLRDQRLKQMT